MIPLLLLAYSHSQHFGFNVQLPDKIALLLSRGANAKARAPRGETCLHLVLRHDVNLALRHDRYEYCWCRTSSETQRYLCHAKDILVLFISAGADVCAVDEKGRSVSEVAIHSGLQTVWTEALKYCGIDIRDVVARPNFDPANSTALNSQYRHRPRSVISKLSLTEYLKRRKPVPEQFSAEERAKNLSLSSSEDDESEDEDSVRDAGVIEARQNRSIEGNEGNYGHHEDRRARKKAKLE